MVNLSWWCDCNVSLFRTMQCFLTFLFMTIYVFMGIGANVFSMASFMDCTFCTFWQQSNNIFSKLVNCRFMFWADGCQIQGRHHNWRNCACSTIVTGGVSMHLHALTNQYSIFNQYLVFIQHLIFDVFASNAMLYIDKSIFNIQLIFNS